MPATNQVQIQKTLEAVARRFYQSGITPDLNQVLTKVSNYFAKNPPGLPVKMDVSTIIENQSTNVDAVNLILANLYHNLSVLYDTAILQTNEVMLENTILLTRIDKITKRQQKLLTQVNDYLFSLYNTGGYYFSISDGFSDTSQTDLTFTSAFVDTTNHQVTIPLLGSGFSTVVPSSVIGIPTIAITDGSGGSLNYTTISPFNFATSGTDNIVWEIQVIQNNPGPVTVEVSIPLHPKNGAVIELSRIDVDPYSTTPYQLYTLVGTTPTTTFNTVNYQNFGNNIITSSNRMSFTGDAKDVIAVKLVMNKEINDYDFQTNDNNGNLQYVYIFGAKDITLTQQVYDNSAVFISSPLSMLSSSSNIIDAVALETKDVVPAGTNIDYFISIDNPQATALSDFNWQSIIPISNNVTPSNIVQYNGAYINSIFIRATPKTSTDLQLLPLVSSVADPTQLNPNPLIIPSVDTYVLANFSDTFLPNSINLEEGINSTRIYYLVESDLPSTPEFWSGVINRNDPSAPSLTYGEIDTGNGFFYGGSLSSDSRVSANTSGLSLFVETYVYIDSHMPPLLDTFYKSDTASKTWDISVFLNGSLLDILPGRNSNTVNNNLTPLDNNLLTWNFQQGINHIALIINIPAPTEVASSIPTPYLGAIDVTQVNPLYTLGTVKLSNWGYVSFFDLEYNQPGTPPSFTVYNDQIISKRQPTTNFRLNYAQESGLAPSAIRLRANLNRSIANETLTPQLDGYSLRFLYGNGA